MLYLYVAKHWKLNAAAAMSYPKILRSLVSASPFTLFLYSARARNTDLPCRFVSPPPRCSTQQAGDVDERMKRVGAQACVNTVCSYRSDTFPLRISPPPHALP